MNYELSNYESIDIELFMEGKTVQVSRTRDIEFIIGLLEDSKYINYLYMIDTGLTLSNYNFIDYNYPTCYDLASKLTKKYSVKTGTTDTDYWTVGYNKNILMVLISIPFF